MQNCPAKNMSQSDLIKSTNKESMLEWMYECKKIQETPTMPGVGVNYLPLGCSEK